MATQNWRLPGCICAAMVDKCLIGRRRLAYEAPFRAIWLAISKDEFDGDGDLFWGFLVIGVADERQKIYATRSDTAP